MSRLERQKLKVSFGAGGDVKTIVSSYNNINDSS